MPKAMGINERMPRRKVQQFQAHGQHDPNHTDGRQEGPCFVGTSVPENAKCYPQQVLGHPDHDIRDHIIGIIPGPEAEIGNVQGIKEDTNHGPEPTQCRFRSRFFLI
ncbi:unnamed protein product [Aspergillus oryzae]|uniref:Unnamed protein product n=2 Tax=Aspergillus oryzae TaxID=5062 RepID=A0AAN4YMY0_ASPOZ|nr:unnamed protein product [Aspergillus oryzae]GMF89103.1 unnamed protein product [Aspergillus oryzae]GMG02863.1 unnamed protein product [Aspergillus oryzae]GMG30304.1 unnamed protein product [Aspergillus oryzae]GMG48818.1 unnamed protein product [Aspergillus oryzae var. brunneus]